MVAVPRLRERIPTLCDVETQGITEVMRTFKCQVRGSQTGTAAQSTVMNMYKDFVMPSISTASHQFLLTEEWKRAHNINREEEQPVSKPWVPIYDSNGTLLERPRTEGNRRLAMAHAETEKRLNAAAPVKAPPPMKAPSSKKGPPSMTAAPMRRFATSNSMNVDLLTPTPNQVDDSQRSTCRI